MPKQDDATQEIKLIDPRGRGVRNSPPVAAPAPKEDAPPVAAPTTKDGE